MGGRERRALASPRLRGGPAALLIDYDYPPWHTPKDTLDQCSAESLQQVGDLLLSICRDENFLRDALKTNR